jgi:hypothetical protein
MKPELFMISPVPDWLGVIAFRYRVGSTSRLVCVAVRSGRASGRCWFRQKGSRCDNPDEQQRSQSIEEGDAAHPSDEGSAIFRSKVIKSKSPTH